MWRSMLKTMADETRWKAIKGAKLMRQQASRQMYLTLINLEELYKVDSPHETAIMTLARNTNAGAKYADEFVQA